MPGALYEEFYAGNPRFHLAADTPDITVKLPGGGVFRMVRRRYALGVGCRRNVPAERIEAAVSALLARYGIDWEQLVSIGTAELKREEAGLLAFAAEHGRELRFFGADELNAVEVPNPSRMAVGFRSGGAAGRRAGCGSGGGKGRGGVCDRGDCGGEGG